eukprot:gnl/TRDRNA2_/TRDRNA2_151089_c0_seq2.p1 gnl/TRDRNA2_/TRDRNA2_151089_c0~~gnl/TRDRNA2_/TRDRNA2_151089_c0_seq2.p1  ORF type:complete len:204 (-),score=41.02 gnl/TRDRNA2_/TRDRNA2_151089_c0_seq2:50-661(-)
MHGEEGDGGATYDGQEGQWAPGGEEAEMNEMMKGTMPLFHDVLWNAMVLDIEMSLTSAIQKILRDRSVEKIVRRKRADALLRLGKLLQEPMLERRRQRHVQPTSPPSVELSADVGSLGTTSTSTPSKKRSMLSRLKPRMPFSPSGRSNRDERKLAQAGLLEDKRRRMEGALAMMAAGASTEDVDEMLAARASMDAHLEARGCD